MSNIKETVQQRLNSCGGESITTQGLSKLREELQDILDKQIASDEGLYVNDFPIEFENHLGKWKIESDGTCHVQPKVNVATVDITFKPTNL